jgi:ribosomal protein S12
LNAARTLRNRRRDQRWADKQYKKRALGTAFKSSPFAGASHAKGIVLEKMYGYWHALYFKEPQRTFFSPNHWV